MFKSGDVVVIDEIATIMDKYEKGDDESMEDYISFGNVDCSVKMLCLAAGSTYRVEDVDDDGDLRLKMLCGTYPKEIATIVKEDDDMENKEIVNETDLGFCPHCLQEYDIDPESDSCTNCGHQIPDGIIDLESRCREADHLCDCIIDILDWQQSIRGTDGSLGELRKIVNEFQGVEYVEQ